MISSQDNVMDVESVSDNFDLTREEEITLLGSVSPLMTSSGNSSMKERKPIVFDLEESTADDDNENDDEVRDKFRTERKTISFTLNEKQKREIPDTLDDQRFKRMRSEPYSKKHRNRSRNRGSRNNFFRNEPHFQRQGSLNRGVDLRQMINTMKQQNNQQMNPFLLNQSLGLTPLMDYQLKTGILNPMAAQNQLLLNTLLAQNGVNPILSRLSGQTSNLLNKVQTPKDDIQITVMNDNNVSDGTMNKTKTQTKSKIRCRVTDMDANDSSDCQIIENVPSMPSTAQGSQKPKLSTMFSKHLADKANLKKAEQQRIAGTSNGGGLFGDALAEVEVGVDNDYLRRMQEQEQKRLEIQRLKEQRRLEMADERLESALQSKQKISIRNQRNY